MADKNRETVQMWTANMLSLENHIEEALDRQLSEVKDHPQASAAVQEFHRMVRSQRDALRAHLQSIGGESSGGLKEAVTGVLGAAAGMIDKIRSEGVSKSLRDDYTAFNLAAIGYHMLNTTALALGERSTAEIAERHLRSYAGAIQKINQIIADVVVWELKKDNHTIVDPQAASTATEAVNRIWRESSPGGAMRTA